MKVRSLSAPPAEPFFLPSDCGDLFCLYYPPAGHDDPQKYLIHVPPFAEEMNKARRMTALQARMLAALGVGVLHIDLYGCGDSAGEFGDATWETWIANLDDASKWLEERSGAPVGIWGLRLGALLALDFARTRKQGVDRIVLWQPVTSGDLYLNQFLRMKLASQMLESGNKASLSMRELRSMLAEGTTVEVAGYELSPRLANAISALKAEHLTVTGCPVHWLEVTANAHSAAPDAATRVFDTWKQRGVDLHTQLVPGNPFWSSQEISTCDSLLSATAAIFSESRP